jgi:hypothetical protein
MGLGYGIQNPGSGKNLFRIPDPGVKNAPDPGSGSPTLVADLNFFPQFCGSETGWIGIILTYRYSVLDPEPVLNLETSPAPDLYLTISEVLRIRDVYSGSRIRNSSIPDSL